jgi:hypothetical protein
LIFFRAEAIQTKEKQESERDFRTSQEDMVKNWGRRDTKEY